MQRWSDIASSSDSSSATDLQQLWLGGVLRPMDVFDRWQASSPMRADEGEDHSTDSAKGKGKPDITDEDFARSLFAEDALLEFAQYSGSLDWLRFATQREKDRVLEEFLDEQANYSTQQIVADLAATLRPLQMENYQNIAVRSMDEDEESAFPVIHHYPFSHSTGNEPGNHICAVCRCDITGKFARLECGCKYDMDCLKLMFEANFNDEYRFPPRCCSKAVALRHVEEELPQETLDLYKTKITEYSTPSRLYCSNAQCAQFLGARLESAAPVPCSACSSETCGVCSAPAHAASVKCRIDKGLRKALKLGQSNGWQRCPRCRQLVERDNGCYHMSCRCGAQFCYLCAAKWNSCNCKYGRNLLVRLVGLRRLNLRGNYLLKGELGANGESSVTRLCKRSWRNVVSFVTPHSQV